jgi:hypothetical protein
MYVLGRGRNASVGPLGSVCQPRGDDEDHSIATPLQSQQQIGNVVVIDIDPGHRNRAVRLRVGDDRVGSGLCENEIPKAVDAGVQDPVGCAHLTINVP